MLLLDVNNKPQNTVFYLSAIIHSILSTEKKLDYSELYEKLSHLEGNKVNIEFYSLALDFLFLLDKLKIDNKGDLYVFKELKN
ncbi:hypothetical protein N2E09_07845 [Leuconostoc citreum]|uniref:ABC-three component system middle component 6 n=1 Tax=Leuconostoc TaxID=1243 RepID=UPI0015CB21F7|nr:ABC-three component system middle component 6 [Leuconostoc gasicomitatum]MBZ5957728.1 hypothetical protein [Leuconostoc gasicomitatum]MBZ5969747.1 hypothetical protein [Leuconostoc gasicomitatum]QLG77358.1 hypothetical protein LeuG3613_00130 [Leuconostoc gasicomitatum]